MKTIIEFIKENGSVIDNKYFKAFWRLFNQKVVPNVNVFGIYLSPELITQDMGYKKVSDFYNTNLRSKYKENIDYVEITKDDVLVKMYKKCSMLKKPHTGGKAQKYYAVNTKTFKKLLLRCQTSNGLSICNYFIDLEQIFISYLHYQCNYHNLNINTEIDELSNTVIISDYSLAIRNKEFIYRLHQLYKIGYVYYIQEECTKNIKIGYTFNLSDRLVQLQTANSQKLSIIKYEKCIFPHIREQQLHKQYQIYHIRGEWFTNMLSSHF